jgi:phosphoribosyl 1,2-cyclic phosphodiesterase
VGATRRTEEQYEKIKENHISRANPNLKNMVKEIRGELLHAQKQAQIRMDSGKSLHNTDGRKRTQPMEFKPIASSSKGNCYLVTSPGVAPLLLEAGIPIGKIKEALGFNLSGVAGALISHCHMDHAKAVKDLLKAGVDCYTSYGTADALGVADHHRLGFLSSEVQRIAESGWYVMPFSLEHDAEEPLGFFIECISGAFDNDKLLFIPDTGYVKNRFNDVNILAIECNHIEGILSENIINGSVPSVAGRRIRRSHMSLERVITMLKSNDLSQCREIRLLHLSNGNSNEKRMIKAVQEATGIPCRVCEE